MPIERTWTIISKILLPNEWLWIHNGIVSSAIETIFHCLFCYNVTILYCTFQSMQCFSLWIPWFLWSLVAAHEWMIPSTSLRTELSLVSCNSLWTEWSTVTVYGLNYTRIDNLRITNFKTNLVAVYTNLALVKPVIHNRYQRELIFSISDSNHDAI
jgi:hypothetical protein